MTSPAELHLAPAPEQNDEVLSAAVGVVEQGILAIDGLKGQYPELADRIDSAVDTRLEEEGFARTTVSPEDETVSALQLKTGVWSGRTRERVIAEAVHTRKLRNRGMVPRLARNTDQNPRV